MAKLISLINCVRMKINYKVYRTGFIWIVWPNKILLEKTSLIRKILIWLCLLYFLPSNFYIDIELEFVRMQTEQKNEITKTLHSSTFECLRIITNSYKFIQFFMSLCLVHKSSLKYNEQPYIFEVTLNMTFNLKDVGRLFTSQFTTELNSIQNGDFSRIALSMSWY